MCLQGGFFLMALEQSLLLVVGWGAVGVGEWGGGVGWHGGGGCWCDSEPPSPPHPPAPTPADFCCKLRP